MALPLFDFPGPCFYIQRASSCLDSAHSFLADPGMEGRFPVWSSVLAGEQSAGRGQLRRAWQSPPGNLYVALRLPLEGPFAGTEAAPVLGLLLAEALKRMGYSVNVKWPNDLVQYLPGPAASGHTAVTWQKVGGILLEERSRCLVAGIGINLSSAPSPSLLREQRAMDAGLLSPPLAAPPLEPAQVQGFWASLAKAVFSCYSELNAKESHKFWRELIPRHMAFLGRQVLLQEGNADQNIAGILEGMDDDGAVRLTTADGSHSFLSGSLVLA